MGERICLLQWST